MSKEEKKLRRNQKQNCCKYRLNPWIKTNNACYSSINDLKLYINVSGNWPVVDSS